MSINLYVYVGPYAECSGGSKPANHISEVENDLTCCNGEGDQDGFDRWIPNREFKHSTSFARHSENKPFIIDGNVGSYRDAFWEEFDAALEVLKKNYASVKIRYGAVPYWW